MDAGKKRRLVQYGRKRRHEEPDADDFGTMFFPNTNEIDQEQKPLPLPPKRPMSQKAATMPSEPDEANVAMLAELTGMGRGDSVRYLKAKNNDIEAAAAAYFDGEDISKAEAATQWDEGAWMGDRDGAGNNESNQLLRPLGVSSAAATRPNSPAPSAGGAATPRSNMHPSSKQEEDEDMARAIAMSQNEFGGGYQQETGIIGSGLSQPHFGPATRDHYEAQNWAMVPAGQSSADEIVPDVDVEQRKHVEGEPRFLKHMPNGDYTPNFLTICHAISGARNALLMRDHLQASYGQDGEWWRGHPISLPKIVHLDDGEPVEPDSDRNDELIAEVQRIIAVLNGSNRSYASIGALTQASVLRNGDPMTTPSRTFLELFVQSWLAAASPKSATAADMANLFTTTVGTTAPGGLHAPGMNLINLQVNIKENEKSELYEELDKLLWESGDMEVGTADNYIQRPAEVLVMRLHQANPSMTNQLRIEVPAELYVDKYLPGNIEATRAVRVEIGKGRKRIARMEAIEKKLRTWKHPQRNEQIDSQLLLKHAHGHFSGQNKVNAAKADLTNGIVVVEHQDANPPHYHEIAENLEKLIASIDNKLTVLEEEKEKSRKAISEMSKAPPPGLEPDELKHRYILRGVATKPSITYVLCPQRYQDDAEMADEDTTPAGMQWWRMEYEVSASGAEAKVTKTKTPDYDVLRAVELEHSSALLVYASENLERGAREDDQLPPALQEFVARDNELFAAELHAEQSKPPTYDLTDVPRESIEPRDRTSMDSMRAEGAGGSDFGDDPPGYNEPMFMDHPEFGLGPEIKQGYREDEADEEAPVHEIRLEDADGEGTEMVEKGHESLIPGLGTTTEEEVGTEMEDVRQWGSGGGSTHMDDMREMR